MQSPVWYVKRLRAMDPEEIAWRLAYKTREISEAIRIAIGRVPKLPVEIVPDACEEGFSPLAESLDFDSYQDEWRTTLLEEAEFLLENKLSYFDLVNVSHGTPMNWHKDHSANIEAPRVQSLFVNYRDFARSGDCKLVWEPNRHHQLVTLGRCYRLTGDLKYAKKTLSLIDDWVGANPYGHGMNWRSPLELGIRLINWVWAIELIKPSGLFTGAAKRQVYEQVLLHIRDISRKYSSGTSANNHLVGEAAGVYIASRYFAALDPNGELAHAAKQILENEIVAQSFGDGCSREHALGYQFFVLQFYISAAIAGERTNSPFSERFTKRLNLMADFLGQVAASGATVPLFGDCDDGKVLSLGDHPHDVSALLAMRDALNHGIRNHKHESTYWLFDANPSANEIATDNTANLLASTRFDDAQYYLLQHGIASAENTSVFFDCADLGYTSIAAHGHADALSFVWSINGQAILVDPGTFDYFSHPELRDFFRSTRSHNTVEIDGTDQSVMDGPFMWSNHARSTCTAWQPSEKGGLITARHSGYLRLDDPVEHQRRVILDGEQKLLTVEDQIGCAAPHDVAIRYHFAPDLLVQLEDHNIVIVSNDTRITLTFDPDLEAVIHRGCESPRMGWYSPGYHQKVETSTVTLKGSIDRTRVFTSTFSWS